MDEPGRNLVLGAADEAPGVEKEEDGGGRREGGGGVDVAFELEAGVVGEDVGRLFKHCGWGFHGAAVEVSGLGMGESRGESGGEGDYRQPRGEVCMYLTWFG